MDDNREGARTPSVETIRALAGAGRRLLSSWERFTSVVNDHVYDLEHDLIAAIDGFAGALEPLEGLDRSAVFGWPGDVPVAFAGLPGEFSAVVGLLGLGPLLAPPAERQSFREARHAEWVKFYDRPFREAAVSAAEGCTLADFEGDQKARDVARWAKFARSRGYTATMIAAEGKALVFDARRAWFDATCYATLSPGKERGDFRDADAALKSGLRILEDALAAVERERRQAADGAPRAGAGAAAGEDAGWPDRWFVSSKSLVLEGLRPNGDKRNTKLLTQLAAGGSLEMRPAEHPIGRRRTEFRFKDREKHERLRQFVDSGPF